MRIYKIINFKEIQDGVLRGNLLRSVPSYTVLEKNKFHSLTNGTYGKVQGKYSKCQVDV